MGWELAAGLNVLIATCYVLISSLILLGLVRTRQLATNPLAVATAAIFTTCAMHHGHHAAHLLIAFGDAGHAEQLDAVRAVFGEWHTVLIDGIGAAVAVTYLGLRHSYKALLNTPAMFDDAVRIAAEQQLRRLAYTDLLTGIPNRAAYQQYADGLTVNGRPVVVLFVDLDSFKGVNDRHGHDAGDRLLREVAQRMEAMLRPDEAVFRLGGDEFVLIGLGYDTAAAEEMVERTRAAIGAPIAVRDGVVSVDASIGVAAGTVDNGIDRLLRDADAAMYAVKAHGRQILLPVARFPGPPVAQAPARS